MASVHHWLIAFINPHAFSMSQMQVSVRSPTIELPALRARFHGLLLAECPFCENLHLHAPDQCSGDGKYCSHCEPDAFSPLAASGYRLAPRGDAAVSASPMVAPVPLSEPRLWRHLRETGGRIRSAALGVLLQRSRAIRACHKSLSGTRLRVAGAHWRYGELTGEGLPVLAGAIYRTDPETAATRLAEAALGLRLDAEAFLDLRFVFRNYFARQPQPWAGRMAVDA